jgi:hypothetical protein
MSMLPVSKTQFASYCNFDSVLITGYLSYLVSVYISAFFYSKLYL